MKILTIIPTYNEAENIKMLVEQILDIPDPPDVLIVDDNSPDRTAEVLAQHFSSDKRIHLLRREKKLGLGTAYSAGFRYTLEKEYSHAVTMDADFSHDPKDIPRLREAASEFGLVIGSRYIPGGATINWSVYRKFISRTANLVANQVLSLTPHDCTSGFRLYQAETLRQLDFESIQADGYSYLVEILYRASRRNIRIGEIPIHFVDRRHGKSKISRKEILKAVQTVLWLRFGPND